MEETTNNQAPVTEAPATAPAAPAPAAPTVAVPKPGAVPPANIATTESGSLRPMRGGRFGQRGARFGGRGPRRDRPPQEKPEFDQKTLDLARVSRVTKGGKRFSFRATVVAGNGKGRVGVGVAKGRDVQSSIQKAYHQAKKRLVTVHIKDGTIPYQVEGKYSSATVILKPSKSGVKAGGAVRVVAQMAGIGSLTGKLTRRTGNQINIARAAILALSSIRASKIK